ncbi:hypothetical protein A3770_09p56550 [Chloropicon primus]|uniref:DUF218 domain-containing protein n=1 Tax=Chloropicon primus TaxID=1764295 RepID=A0A5B8MS80_9CHLO|nr:hypothetical protein A3770_09p56550 [Chloropicon primus]|mmetsp:Transcript_12181/g.33778  ORF Transcript_12181/g.33778 Transcript_12181/m.33778 type:complete len:243 (+) Transcript_12181:1175-1903(+)|eukprot:QDZ23137.1 hypothetical protein A3770_09p56550 [Chloropicon primus]
MKARSWVVAVVAAVAVATPLLTRYLERAFLESGTRIEPRGEGSICVVLGFALHKDGSPTPDLRDRVRQGLHLFERGAVGSIVFSGGHPGGGLRGNKSEAEVMATYAKGLRLGREGHSSSYYSYSLLVDEDDDQWFLEEESTSTRTNALFTIRKISGEGIGGKTEGGLRIVVVTSPFHQYRSGLTFQKAFEDLRAEAEAKGTPLGGEMTFSVARMEEGEASHRVKHVLREVAAIVWYKLKGWI